MATRQHTKHKLLSLAILCFVCLFVAAEPIRIVNASLNTASTMPCCAGKAGHCDSGIVAKKVPPPKSEPMCGLHGAEMESDGITIVAEPVVESPHSHSHGQTAETNSSYPGAESKSLGQPCHMDCTSCAAGATRQQKRERTLVQTIRQQPSSVTTQSRYEEQALLSSSAEYWEQASPRGPPAISAE